MAAYTSSTPYYMVIDVQYIVRFLLDSELVMPCWRSGTVKKANGLKWQSILETWIYLCCNNWNNMTSLFHLLIITSDRASLQSKFTFSVTMEMNEEVPKEVQDFVELFSKGVYKLNPPAGGMLSLPHNCPIMQWFTLNNPWKRKHCLQFVECQSIKLRSKSQWSNRTNRT